MFICLLEFIDIEDENVNENESEDKIDESNKAKRLPSPDPEKQVPFKKRPKVSDDKPDSKIVVENIEQIESDEYSVILLDESNNILLYQGNDNEANSEKPEQNCDSQRLAECKSNETTTNVHVIEQQKQYPAKSIEKLKTIVATKVCDSNASEGSASVSSSVNELIDSKDDETYFVLSLAGILKRLPPHKRAIAKCHILSYLTELEYGSTSFP